MKKSFSTKFAEVALETPEISIVNCTTLQPATNVGFQTAGSIGVDIVINHKVTLLPGKLNIIRTGLKIITKNWDDPGVFALCSITDEFRKRQIFSLDGGIIDLRGESELVLLLQNLNHLAIPVNPGEVFARLLFLQSIRPNGIATLSGVSK